MHFLHVILLRIYGGQIKFDDNNVWVLIAPVPGHCFLVTCSTTINEYTVTVRKSRSLIPYKIMLRYDSHVHVLSGL